MRSCKTTIVIKSGSEEDMVYEVQSIVTGKVLGENNTPLSGVAVQVKGTTKGATTNAEGIFLSMPIQMMCSYSLTWDMRVRVYRLPVGLK